MSPYDVMHEAYLQWEGGGEFTKSQNAIQSSHVDGNFFFLISKIYIWYYEDQKITRRLL